MDVSLKDLGHLPASFHCPSKFISRNHRNFQVVFLGDRKPEFLLFPSLLISRRKMTINPRTVYSTEHVDQTVLLSFGILLR